MVSADKHRSARIVLHRTRNLLWRFRVEHHASPFMLASPTTKTPGRRPRGSCRFVTTSRAAARWIVLGLGAPVLAPAITSHRHAAERGREQQQGRRQRNLGNLEAIAIGVDGHAGAADVTRDAEEVVAGREV